jgi:hypothetical protein
MADGLVTSKDKCTVCAFEEAPKVRGRGARKKK